MATKLILSKESGENEIRDYFNSILKLSKMNEEFPVNFDEAWPLVFSERGNAMRNLKENFIEGVDFNLIQKDKVIGINGLRI